MKKYLILTIGMAFLALPLTVLVPKEAHAYNSPEGSDPDRTGIGNGAWDFGTGDIETKAVKKSGTAGASEALISGLVVAYDPTALDGYTVTRAVAQQTNLALNTYACVITETVATGDTAYHRCITKGFARVRYVSSGTTALVAGRMACVNASGVVRGCDYGNTLEATANTGIIPLTAPSGTGTDLKVLINLR